MKDPVCGLVSLDLVKRITGGASLDTPDNQKMTKPSDPNDFFYQCSVRNSDTYTTVVQMRVASVVDKNASLQQVERDKQSDYGTKFDYDGGFGQGYGTAYDDSRGPWKDGARVDVLRGDMTYNVVVYNWPTATSAERRKLAEEMVLDIEKNLAAKAGKSAPAGAPARSVGTGNADRLRSRLGG